MEMDFVASGAAGWGRPTLRQLAAKAVRHAGQAGRRVQEMGQGRGAGVVWVVVVCEGNGWGSSGAKGLGARG